jgi:hypothetical protein
MRALNQAERDLFNRIVRGGYSNLALVSTECNGVETGSICQVETDGQKYRLFPLAVLVNDDVFRLLKAP